ncbi:hypothetical protein GIB67_018908 [Kingdonia uniflora]|uniref:RING-type E3 ubiquitin transferase n=1 Tax=Kingdonia uniflora TaxID=39325 RepID=A0A7J7L2Q5_9MAGN|nr:hypothetical protein GIB67_018908 [Kingdonia uniflora]
MSGQSYWGFPRSSNRSQQQIGAFREEIYRPRFTMMPEDEVAVLDLPRFCQIRRPSYRSTRTTMSYEEVVILDLPGHELRRTPHTSYQNRQMQLHNMSYEGVAILNMPGHEFRGTSRLNGNMQLDSVPYEELLTLQERIGHVNVGLSQEVISSGLKVTCSELENEGEMCVICQDDIRTPDKVGTLCCGHEYHAGCIKDWLMMKNMCPICKRPGLL